jgi:hypothetical protein
MGRKTYTVVYSNYTMQVFVWSGTPDSSRKFLGNRQALAGVEADNEQQALAIYRRSLPLPRTGRGRVPKLS